MSMLPDVPSDEYNQYAQQQFDQQTGGQIDQLGFQHLADSRIGTLTPPAEPPAPVEPPPPPPAAESLSRIGSWTTIAPAPQPEPEPAPTPTPAPTDTTSAPVDITPPEEAAPTPTPAPVPEPVPSPQATLDDVRATAPQAFHQAQQSSATDAVPYDPNSGRVFPVQGYTGQVDLHWGDVKGGSDLFAPRGTPVLTMEPGKVIESGYNSVGGNSVLIQGDDGNQYYYAHMDAKPAVAVGQQVGAGTYLGPVGDTGDAKGRGTHLHIGIGPEIRLGADKYGGTGGDYDAVGLLRATLASQDNGGSTSAPITGVQTTAGLSGGGTNSGQVGDRGQQILSGAADTASWLGDQGQKVLQAILVTEGGLNNARGDSGASAGPLQFYEGGQLANFARQNGLSLDAAKNYVEQHPLDAIQWAIGTVDNPGYLGTAIARGIAQGLTGAALATYAQRTGQVSESPERAGANYNALFGQGQDLIRGTGQALGQAQQAVGNVFANAGQGAQQALQQIPVFAQNVPSPPTGAASSMVPDQGSPLDRLKGAFSDFVDYLGNQSANARQAVSTFATVVGNAVGPAVSTVAFGTPEQQAARQQAFSELAAGQGVQAPQTFGESLAGLLGSNAGGLGPSAQQTQAIEAQKDQIIAQNNPIRDWPVVGGLSTAVAQQMTNPILLAAGGPIGSAAEVGGSMIEGLLGSRLAGTVTRGALDAGLFNATAEASANPNATPQTVAEAFVSGAGLGGVAGAGVAGIRALGSPAGRQAVRDLTDYVTSPEAQAALRARESTGPFATDAARIAEPSVAPLYQAMVDERGVPLTTAESAAPSVLATREAGYVNPRYATSLAGAVGGGYAGFQTDPNAPLPERLARAGVGALAGAGLGYGAAGLLTRGAAPGYDSRLVSSPELQRLGEMFDPATAAQPAPGTPGLIQRVSDNITRALTDRRVDINRVQENYARQLGRPLRANEMAAELQRLAADPAAEQMISEQLKPAVQSVGRDYRALRDYTTLRNNVEVDNALGNNARLFSGGLTGAESTKALQDLEQELGPTRFATVQRAGDQVSRFSNMLRQRLVDSAVLSQQQAIEMETKYPNWVKTRILDYMDREGPNSQPAGSKIGLSSRDVHAYTQAGTVRQREDPIASTVAYAHQVERMARKNEAFNAFLNIDQASPTPQLRRVAQDFTPTRDQVTVQGFVNGVKQKYVTDNKALGNAINGSGVLSTPEWTSAWQRAFRALATSRNPLFLAGNAALDIPTYTFRSAAREGGPQSLPRVLTELARGYADAFAGFNPAAIARGEFGPNTARFLKGGGGQSGFFTGGEGISKQAVQELQRRHVFQIDGAGDIGRLVKDLLTLKPVESLGERIELGPRVAAMRLAERRGANPVQAVIDGRNVTVDFSQGGTATKYLNQFIPFFNVGFQGPAQIARAYRANPRAFVATMGTLIGLPTVAAEAWNRGYNPDGTRDRQRARDYADVPQYVKDQGVVVMLPGQAPTDAQGNRKPLYAVVKLREFAPFAAIARESAARALGDDSRSWSEVASSVGSGLSPTNSTSLAQLGTEPLAGIPILPALAQIGMNQDWFRGRTIVSQRADDNASALAKSLTPHLQQLTDAAGVNAEVRPSAVDFLIRNQGAGVGDALLGASNLLSGYSPPSRGGPSDVPVVGGLAGRFVGSQTGQQFETAAAETLTPSARQILRDNGITTTPGAVGSSVNQIPLKQEEQARYQQLANRYIDDAIHRATSSSDWATLTQRGRQSRIQQVMDGARARAGNEVLNTIPAEEKQRRLRTRSTASAA